MILFAGIPSEPPIALAIEAATRLQIPFAVFNQRHSKYCDIRIDSCSEGLSGEIWLNERSFPLSGFQGIYARTVDPRTLPENRPRRTAAPNANDFAKSIFLNDAFTEWLDISPGRVANRPAAMGSNSSKPYQTQLVRAHGFQIPPTLVTNDPDQVHAFHARHGRIVYKSTSAIRSIVNEWHPDDSARLARLQRLPTQFQALIPGHDVRVHVAGDRPFASEIASDAVDYRYAHRYGQETTMRPIELPVEISERCVSLTRALGLEFSGIDLKRTPDDEWYCFEVNTSPGYSYFEQQTGQPIAEALVAHLSKM